MSCPQIVSSFSTPKVLWYQTDLTVALRILLPDVSDYYLRVKNNYLLFSTITNDIKYYLILYLFGTVLPEKTVHRNVGREIKIYLTKGLKWFSWLRLTISKEKNPLIVYDLNYTGETNFVPKERSFIKEYKRQNNIKYIMPAASSSDEEEFEDDYFDLQYA